MREYLFMSVCPNTGFIGLTVVAALLGSESVLTASIFTMVHTFLITSVGLGIIAPEEAGEEGVGSSRTGRAKNHIRSLAASLLTPLSVACFATIALVCAQVELPGLVMETLDMIGGVTSPLALMLLGVMLEGIDFKGMLLEFRLYPYIFIRQLVVPLVLYAGLLAAGVDATVTGVFTLMFAMPVGTMVSLFVEQAGRDAQLALKGTILSTVASFVAIPGLVTAMTLL